MVVLTLLAVLCFVMWCRKRRLPGTNQKTSKRAPAVGFIHPASGGGGGGERVLWVAIKALMEVDIINNVDRDYVVYTRQFRDLPALVQDQFAITLPKPVRTVVLRRTLTALTESACYPRLTLLLQTVVGGLALFVDIALLNAPVDVMIDTVGYPFLYPLLSIFSGCRIATYTHYPTISTDMIQRVRSGNAMYNNDAVIARNRLLTEAKLLYFRAFSLLYAFCGRFPDRVMTNSTWTNDHIKNMWPAAAPTIVYPPCNIAALATLDIDEARTDDIVSVGQFRPEKNHVLQLRSFALAKLRLPAGAKLFIVGGARNDEDRARVEVLKAECQRLNLRVPEDVDFRVSAPFSMLRELLARCAVGLHAMTDEHFGIVVAEYQAAGCIPVAHCSGGVKADIVLTESTGVLAKTEKEYADALVETVQQKNADAVTFRQRQVMCRSSAARFSDEYFSRKLIEQLSGVI